MIHRRHPALWVAVVLLALVGLYNAIGGVWLISAHGSWYYAIAAVGFLATAALLAARRPEALWVYALLVAGTLVWALWEVGFDWWPLAARGDVIFLLGLFILTPWITRSLFVPDVRTAMDGTGSPPTAFRGGGLALSLSLVFVLAVGVTSWFTDLHAIDGTVPEETASIAPEAGIPDGEWQAYGRTGMGQRYSPLAEITPANVSSLQTAWTFETGDSKQPGDPVETTFEVTPLKIGDRLFLCTPHQNVIALDADTGKEIWRYDPKIQGELALQHLTCRGLSYHAATDDHPPRPLPPHLRRRMAPHRRPSQPRRRLQMQPRPQATRPIRPFPSRPRLVPTPPLPAARNSSCQRRTVV